MLPSQWCGVEAEGAHDEAQPLFKVLGLAPPAHHNTDMLSTSPHVKSLEDTMDRHMHHAAQGQMLSTM